MLVFHDLLGLYEGRSPRFVKRYADLYAAARDALERHATEVRAGAFPGEEHTYAMPEEELTLFRAATQSALVIDRCRRRSSLGAPRRPPGNGGP